MTKHKIKEGNTVSYNQMNGEIVFVGRTYFTLRPINSNSLVLVFRENWHDVTLEQLAQPA